MMGMYISVPKAISGEGFRHQNGSKNMVFENTSTSTVAMIKSLSSELNQLLQLCTAHTAWSDSDQAVRAVHSCNSW